MRWSKAISRKAACRWFCALSFAAAGAGVPVSPGLADSEISHSVRGDGAWLGRLIAAADKGDGAQVARLAKQRGLHGLSVELARHWLSPRDEQTGKVLNVLLASHQRLIDTWFAVSAAEVAGAIESLVAPVAQIAARASDDPAANDQVRGNAELEARLLRLLASHIERAQGLAEAEFQVDARDRLVRLCTALSAIAGNAKLEGPVRVSAIETLALAAPMCPAKSLWGQWVDGKARDASIRRAGLALLFAHHSMFAREIAASVNDADTTVAVFAAALHCRARVQPGVVRITGAKQEPLSPRMRQFVLSEDSPLRT